MSRWQPGETPEDIQPATRTAGAWLRAAIELESWINDDYVGDIVRQAMRARVVQLRALAGNCWCGGDYKGYAKHMRRTGIDKVACAASREANNAYQAERRRKRREGWQAGTEVDLDDDAL